MADPPPLPDSLPPLPIGGDPEGLQNGKEDNASNLSSTEQGSNEDKSSRLHNSSARRKGPSLSEVVLQVKPRPLTGSKSASEVGSGRKPRAGNFSNRLKKIKETRTKKDGDTALLHHSTSTPVVATPTPQSLGVLPGIQESVLDEDPPSTLHDDDRSTLIEKTPTKEKEVPLVPARAVPAIPAGNNIYDQIEDNLQTSDDPLSPSPAPPTTAHVYDMIVPADPRDNDTISQLPPLPATPPPATTPIKTTPTKTTPRSVSPLTSNTFIFDSEHTYNEPLTATPTGSREEMGPPLTATPTGSREEVGPPLTATPTGSREEVGPPLTATHTGTREEAGPIYDQVILKEDPPPFPDGLIEGPPLPMDVFPLHPLSPLDEPPLPPTGPPPLLDGPPDEPPVFPRPPLPGKGHPSDLPPIEESPIDSVTPPSDSPPLPLTDAPPLPPTDAPPLPPTDAPPLLPTDAPPLPPTDAPPLPPTDTPPLLPTDAPPLLPTDSPLQPPAPPTNAPPLPSTDDPSLHLHTDSPLLSLAPPTGAPPLLPADTPPLPPADSPPLLPANAPPLPPADSPGPAPQTIKDASIGKSSPYLNPGYVQFSTQGSSLSIEPEDSNYATVPMVSSSITSFNSFTTDTPHGTVGGINRPSSVSSLLHHHEQPFQSNLKKWRFTDLTDEDKQPSSRPSSLPSSGHMRRIQSNIEKTISSNMHSSSSGINQSLDSITESHTPPATPTPSPPSLIQRRLTTGDIDSDDVTVTQVAKTRWSLVVSELNEETGQSSPRQPVDETKSKTRSKEELSLKHQQTSGTVLRDDNKQHKKPKKTLSLNENLLLSGKLRNDNSELYDTEGPAEGEGNLHKINQGIPKSLSSLFDSVVSDIPGLASSDEEDERERGVPREQKKEAGLKEVGVKEAGLKQTLKEPTTTKESVKKDTPKKNSPSVSKPKKTFQLQNLPSDAPPTATPTKSSQNKKAERQSESKSKAGVANVVHKRNVGKRSETLKPMKIFMQKIHPGLMYKMFMISTSTTAHEVVEQGLEKANIIDDPRCFALYEVYDSTQEVLRVLQEQDCPLSSAGNTSSAPTHLELRRFRVHQSKSIQISSEFLFSTKKRPVQLTISNLTTSKEVAILCLRKLKLYNDSETDQQRNKYKMMIVDKKASEEWLIDDDRYLLEEVKEGSVIAIVDIERYLLKGREERSFMEKVLPDDPHVMKALLKESNDKVDSLQTDVLLKDHMIKQLRGKLEGVTNANQEMESINSLKEKYTELQESSAKEIKELQAALDRANEEAKEKEDSIEKILSGIEARYETITDKNTTIEKDVAAAKNEMVKLIEEKQIAVSSLEASLSEKEGIITGLNSEMEEMRTSLSGEGLNQLQRSADANELDKEVESSLRDRVLELENENEQLKTAHQATPIKETKSTENFSNSSLFHVLGGSGVSKHILIAVEAIPSCDSGGGLGVKLSDALDGSSGCIVKSVAESSSVNGVLLSGDRLLEMNGHLVMNCSKKDIVSIVQGQSGPIRIIASRPVSQEEVEEKLAKQLTVNEQLREDNERLKGELSLSSSTLTSAQSQLKDNQTEIDSLKKQLSDLSNAKSPSVNDIHSLRHQLSHSHSSELADGLANEYLADTLKESTKGEILDTLRTVESECLGHKRSFDRLLEVIVTHNPDLLEIIANETNVKKQADNEVDEVEDADGWC